MSAELDLPGMGRLILYEPLPFHILYVEDDPTNAAAVVENLRERGLTSVDVVTNAREATKRVAEKRYDVVMADVVLDNAPQVKGPDKQGDEWLLESLGMLRGAKTAVVTGRRKRIVDLNRLKDAGVRVVEKGTPAVEFFTEIEGDARAKSESLNTRLEGAVREVLTGDAELARKTTLTAGEALVEAAAATLTHWIESLQDRNTQDLWIAGQAMSPMEILHEVAQRTETGRRVLRMCVREMADALGIPDIPEGVP